MDRCEICGLFSCDGNCEGPDDTVEILHRCGHRQVYNIEHITAGEEQDLKDLLCDRCHAQWMAAIAEEEEEKNHLHNTLTFLRGVLKEAR